MNRTLTTLLIGFLLSTASAVKSQIDLEVFEAFEDLIGAQPSVEINLGPMMLGLLSSATQGEDNISTVLSGLNSIKVTVFELEDRRKIREIRALINVLAELKMATGHEKLAVIREDDSLVFVLAKKEGEHFKNLTVFSLDDEEELVLIEIQGSILFSQLGELTNHFDVDLDINRMKFKKQGGKDQ